MALRDIIEIDDSLCDGCGVCVPACHEGALAVIDGKLRVIDDARCDGAGACIGECPKGALKVIQREASPFDEQYVKEPPPSPAPFVQITKPVALHAGGGCPGSRTASWTNRFPEPRPLSAAPTTPSALRQWPVQLHLVSPEAPFWNGKEMLLAADCVAFSLGGFHSELLEGRSLAIACPKLDDPQGYAEKLTRILSARQVTALRVVVMEVPCCGGLSRLALDCARRAGYAGEIEILTVSMMGDITRRQTVQSAKAADQGLEAGAGPH